MDTEQQVNETLREDDIDAAFLTLAASISSGDILSPEKEEYHVNLQVDIVGEIICIRYALCDKVCFDLAALISNSFK